MEKSFAVVWEEPVGNCCSKTHWKDRTQWVGAVGSEEILLVAAGNLVGTRLVASVSLQVESQFAAVGIDSYRFAEPAVVDSEIQSVVV